MNVAGAFAEAHQSVVDDVAVLRAGCDPAAGVDARVAALVAIEELGRRLGWVAAELLAGLDRDGVFAERGCVRAAPAVADLWGCGYGPAARRVRLAELVCAWVGLDGQVLGPRLAATAAASGGGGGQRAARGGDRRCVHRSRGRAADAGGVAGVEEQLAGRARVCTPRELAGFARDLVNALDQDGADPEDREPVPVNELYLLATPGVGGGRINARLDAASFDAVLGAVDALAPPVPADERSLAQRRADGCGELARQRLDRGDLPVVGGDKPQLSVTVSLEELAGRARGAALAHGGVLTAVELRRIACDAQVVPIVLDGDGAPLDIGRGSRVVPAPLRRALAVRDRGCAFPGCHRPPGWCDAHHVREWQRGGPTALPNLVLLCRFHHRLVHRSEWQINLARGRPEFIPPRWIDPDRIPRQKPPPMVADYSVAYHS